jgi:hypothetical protein
LTQQDHPHPFCTHIVSVSVAKLQPFAKNPRTHSKKQIRQIAESLRTFGFTNPVLISDDDEIIAGHRRVEAATQLQMPTVPAVRLSYLNAAERGAYVLADSKLALNAGWDRELLAIELQTLADLDFDVEITVILLAEVDLVLDEAQESGPDLHSDPSDEVPCPPDLTSATTRAGDLWLLGWHRLLCGDGRSRESFDRLLDGERVDLIFTRAGAIAFLCMDWRYLGELLAAGEVALSELRNVCHELVFVFKASDGPPTNTFGLGDIGRYRTNAWDSAGVNSLRSGRAKELATHPTVKPVALVADAIKDCSRVTNWCSPHLADPAPRWSRRIRRAAEHG